MRHFAKAPRLRLLTSAAPAGLLLAAALSGIAYGQTTDETVDTITVSGFRGSLAAAIDTKRENTGVVDAIMAEDIADFPDLNLAEAIQRLPGVAIDRDAGEGRQATVRGLSPDFTRVRINGMEALSTTGGTDSSGGANRSRSFDFNTFASDLFQSIMVRKTQSAAVDEGSLGSTIDLRTARPFDFRGFTLTASGQIGYNDLAEEFNPRLGGLISDQTDDGTFGWLFSIAYSDRSLLEEGHSTVRWQNANSFGSCARNNGATPCSAAETTALNSAFHPRIPRFGRLSHDQERLGMTGALQFRPSNATEINLEIMHSRFEATRSEQFIENFALSRGGSATPQIVGKANIDVLDFEIDANNNLVWLVGDDMDIYSENRYDELNTNFTQFTASISHDFTDRFRVDGLIGSVESAFSNPVQTTILFTYWDAPGFSYDYRQNNEVPLINWGFDVTDPANFQFTEYRDRPNSVTNTYQTAQFNAEFDLTPDFTLRGGVSWKAFEYDATESRRDRQLSAAEWATVTPNMANLLTGFGRGLGGPSGNVTSWATPDIGVVAGMVNLYSLPLNPQNGAINNVQEDSTAIYAMADFRTMVGGMPLAGDFGVRYVETETASTGIISGVSATVNNEYADTLPALNLALDLTDDIVLRFGAAQVMSRPTLGSLTPGGSIGGTTYTVSYGNPLLDPFRATNYDFSFEWYFAPESLFAVAVFYKDIDTFITRGTETLPFSATGLPNSAVATGTPLRNDLDAGIDPLVTVTRNVNGEGGSLSGLELQYQQPFVFLPAPFDRFGFVGNYTWVDSEVNYGAAGTNQLRGLSPTSYNATLYYEDDRLRARVSVHSRDEFLTQFPGRNGNNEEGKRSTFNVDVAASYQVNENFTLTFEGVNLTDEFNHQYVDTANRVSVYHHTGREFLFGARYRY